MHSKIMQSKFIFAAALALSAPNFAFAQNAETATNDVAAEVEIPFVQFGAIRDWRPDGRNGLYIQGTGDQWYYAKLMGSCNGLNFTDTVAFDTGRGARQLDRFSSVLVEGQTCQFTSLVKSDPPKIERKKRK